MAIKVSIPLAPEKGEWKLTGQMLSYTLPIGESVVNLKAKIQEETNMPPAKQKLFFDVSLLFVFVIFVIYSFGILGDVLQRQQHFGVL